ncbi:MAG TPA: hypothetical protein VN428_24690, partial [Bryobacteraceae bacterium]|nr:hypothetical protein [Bryobacteraceae bacterium]
TGRRVANATYFASHGVDEESAITYAMDLTPLIDDPKLPPEKYVLGFVEQLRADIENRLKKLG